MSRIREAQHALEEWGKADINCQECGLDAHLRSILTVIGRLREEIAGWRSLDGTPVTKRLAFVIEDILDS